VSTNRPLYCEHPLKRNPGPEEPEGKILPGPGHVDRPLFHLLGKVDGGQHQKWCKSVRAMTCAKEDGSDIQVSTLPSTNVHLPRECQSCGGVALRRRIQEAVESMLDWVLWERALDAHK
jgi:hypothetical protein